MLIERAGKSDVRDEQQLFLEARQVLITDRAALMAEFEKRLRAQIEDHVSGRADEKADFSKADASKLALIDLNTIDESVIIGNIVRVVENACHEELITLNRGIGHLLGKSVLESAANPLGPMTVVSAFAEALGTFKAEGRLKFQILKELNQAPLGEVAAIYADVNRHLANLRIIPAGTPRIDAPRGSTAQRKRAADEQVRSIAAHGGDGHDGDVPARGLARRLPAFRPSGAATCVYPPLPPTPSGYVPGSPIVATPGSA